MHIIHESSLLNSIEEPPNFVNKNTLNEITPNRNKNTKQKQRTVVKWHQHTPTSLQNLFRSTHTSTPIVRAFIFAYNQNNRNTHGRNGEIRREKNSFSRKTEILLLTLFDVKLENAFVIRRPFFNISNTLFIFRSISSCNNKIFVIYRSQQQKKVECIVYQSQRNLLNSTECDTFTQTHTE